MVDRIGSKFVARCLEDLGRRPAVIDEFSITYAHRPSDSLHTCCRSGCPYYR
jgi:hypothetical protein